MNVLLVKMSSMGDVVHTLPALTDAMQAIEGITFDWVVEKSFSDIPQWHPAVNRVIPIELRKWRKEKQWSELSPFLEALRETDYDLVIDAQGLVKSAWVALAAKGPSHGPSWKSAREPWASLFYRHRHNVVYQQHAVERVRDLFAKALGYEKPSYAPDYGLVSSVGAPSKDWVFIANTTWPSKHWPQAYWRELTRLAVEAGDTVHFTSGTPQEWRYIEGIAKGLPRTVLYPRQSINQVMTLLAGAKGVVAVDTGFGQLAAALAKPCVSLFGPTNPELSRPYGPNQRVLNAEFECSPCMLKVCNHPKRHQAISPPCYQALTPERVWQMLTGLLEAKSCRRFQC